MNIRELTTDREFLAAFDVMHELRDDLGQDDYMAFLGEMRSRGYRLIAAEEGGRIVALAGIEKSVNFYYRRYMWVYDLVTSASVRSKGYGLALLQHVERLAREEGCETLALSSGLQRTDAHRFYLDKVGMEKRSFTFAKTLT
ncbi:MAG: GNAT family N-acetyltransferase [Actinobacteria bacterium]|nr:GNAT family N-acetyltransferase [Actinomycetota bacterium]